MKRVNALFMNKLVAAVVLLVLFALALWLVLGQGANRGDNSVADSSNLSLVQTVPAVGTAIKTGDTVQFELRAPGLSGQTVPALALEVAVSYDVTKLSLVDVIPAVDLLSVNKTINNTTGRGTIDVALPNSTQSLPDNYPWVTFKFTAVNTGTSVATVTGSVIVTYTDANNQPIQGTTTIAASVNLSSTTTSSSSASSASTSTAASSSSSTTTATTSSTTTATGQIVCGPVDVDGNVYLDIVDFAAFAKLYNKACDSHTGVTSSVSDYLVGQSVTLDLPLKNVPSGANAVDVDVKITGATVANFVPTTASGWLSAIGFCNTAGAVFTSNSVCAALAKSSNILSGESAGKLTLSFATAGTAVVSTNTKFAYSGGSGKVSANYTMYNLTIGSSTTPVDKCGNQDANNDSVVDLNDFSRFGRAYRLANCGVN